MSGGNVHPIDDYYQNPKPGTAADAVWQNFLFCSQIYGPDDPEIASLLASPHMPMTRKTDEGMDVLMLLISRHHTGLARKMLDTGAFDVNAVTAAGFTPLIIAVMYDTPDMIVPLLCKKADMHQKDTAGHSAIDRARLKTDSTALEIMTTFEAEHKKNSYPTLERLKAEKKSGIFRRKI